MTRAMWVRHWRPAVSSLLPQEPLVATPLKGLSVGAVVRARRQPDGLSSQIVLVPTILKILPKALAHDKPVISVYTVT